MRVAITGLRLSVRPRLQGNEEGQRQPRSIACAAVDVFPADSWGAQLSYPKTCWRDGPAEDLSWPEQRIAEIGQYLDTVPAGSLMIVDSGRVVAQWGDVTRRAKLSSARKSLLSALIGLYVHEGRLDLSTTLAQLNIDDVPPLTAAERQATVSDLLKARSGVYRGFVGGTPAMRAEMPARGSHAPGTFWYYNNWDFNVAGAILEKQAGITIGKAFHDRIAAPLQMQDFRPSDVYYVAATPGTPPEDTSIHPAYQFQMSARDIARFGHLFLCGGTWNDIDVVPASWVRDSTTSYSDAGEGATYGYFWWINDWRDVPEPHYTAKGTLGKNLVIFPAKGIVVVYLNDADYPDFPESLPDAELDALPKMTKARMAGLLNLILAAAPKR
jgi:CubicO group peptidase (beta-lactamase class C family)